MTLKIKIRLFLNILTTSLVLLQESNGQKYEMFKRRLIFSNRVVGACSSITVVKKGKCLNRDKCKIPNICNRKM